MLVMFAKPLQELSSDDVKDLILEKVPEDATVEFKETIPHKKGGVDTWCAGGNEVGDYGRNEILEEVIALANTHGGHIVLGVGESDDQPHRAVKIMPLPKCDELAARFRHFLRDGVDPQIPLVQVHGVRTDGERGVVVFRVPQSRMAPHRHKWTLQAYYRHADRTEKMTMREVQDLTLRISHGFAEIEATFKKRQHDFEKWATELQAPGVRATLIPLSPLFSGRVHGNTQLFPPWKSSFIVSIGDLQREAGWGVQNSHERPILRGSRRYIHDKRRISLFQEGYSDGLMEIRLVRLEQQERFMFFGWIVTAVANGLLMADQFRKTVGSPDIEYGVELQVFDPLGPLPIRRLQRDDSFDAQLAHPIEPPGLFPRYSFGPGPIGPLFQSIMEDIYDAGGESAPNGPYALTWSG